MSEITATAIEDVVVALECDQCQLVAGRKCC